MSYGDRTLFGTQVERAQRRSSGRGKRKSARGGGARPTPKPSTTPAKAPASAQAATESIEDILRETREAEQVHRARLEARIAELERELKEARAAAAATPVAKPDLGFLDLQATLAAQQVEQQHREALDLFLTEASLRADDEERFKEIVAGPALIPTLLDAPEAVPATPRPAPKSAASNDIQERLESATVAMEAAEARAAHNATQVKRLTEELMSARQEQMRTATRLRDLEERLRKAEARTGIVEDRAEAVPPKSEKPDHSMPLPLVEANPEIETGTDGGAEAAESLDSDGTPGDLLDQHVAPGHIEDPGNTLSLDDAPEDAVFEELAAAPDIAINDVAEAFDAPVEMAAPEPEAEDEPGLERETESDATDGPGDAPSSKSPIDALADVLSEWDEPRKKKDHPSRAEAESPLGEPATTESEAEPDIAEALASWSRGELKKPPAPDIEDFVKDLDRAAIDTTDAPALESDTDGISLEDALSNWGASDTGAEASPVEESAPAMEDDLQTAEADQDAAASPQDDDPFGEPGAASPSPEALDAVTAEASPDADPPDAVVGEPDSPFDTPVSADDIPDPDTLVVTEEDADETAHEAIVAEESPAEIEVTAEPETQTDPETIAAEEIEAPPVEVLDADAEQDFEPDPAPPQHEAPIAARARDNATRINENLQQWSGLQGARPRPRKDTPAHETAPVAASADSPKAPRDDDRREQGKKAMVDALLKFMGK